MNVTEMFDMNGRVGCVTGAASGLGFAMAEALAEAGAHVVMTDVDAPGLDAAAARLRAAGLSVDAQVLDVSHLDALARAINGIVARHGRLDVMFANAGISAGPGFAFGDAGRIGQIDLDHWRRVLDVNLTAATWSIKAAAKHMIAQQGGRIVVTASIGGIRAEPFVGYAYAATKSAMLNVVRQAAVDLAPHNVLVNAIAPGPFLTNIAGGRLHREPLIAAQFASAVPLRRLASPDEIKGLALLLASPAGSFITGTVIPVDGGATAAV
ncbi:SDR family NAD(P)-dependent oxidoreductase [Paraburkholderia guartelaensis]|uniref:SDR family NAD(P)-dependent oxidoreductase n=1 Tax=Paraburkholderia guartelaensis TaxID=2546446 RepID=UPI002AB7BDAA|nr:SDR family NAD(P)-dependent oxidoreductase [Paraburkholderia guartelaensis]